MTSRKPQPSIHRDSLQADPSTRIPSTLPASLILPSSPETPQRLPTTTFTTIPRHLTLLNAPKPNTIPPLPTDPGARHCVTDLCHPRPLWIAILPSRHSIPRPPPRAEDTITLINNSRNNRGHTIQTHINRLTTASIQTLSIPIHLTLRRRTRRRYLPVL